MIINDKKCNIILLYSYFRVYFTYFSNYFHELIYNRCMSLLYEEINDYFLLKYKTKQRNFFFIYS